MKFILDVNDPDRRYKLNLYSTFEYENGSVSEDCRVLEGDDLDEFLTELRKILQEEQNGDNLQEYKS